jgi:hypothetical protein
VPHCNAGFDVVLRQPHLLFVVLATDGLIPRSVFRSMFSSGVSMALFQRLTDGRPIWPLTVTAASNNDTWRARMMSRLRNGTHWTRNSVDM